MVAKTATISIGLRLQNALVTYVRYVSKMVWPSDLSALYTHPNLEGGAPWALWQVAGAGALLTLVSTAVFRSSRRYLWVGWLWYLGTLVPVIGLVQVGRQAMADRYTYVPLIGLFVIAAWGGADLARFLRLRSHRLGQVLPLTAAIALAASSVLSWHQVQIWRDSFTLNRHALQVTPGDPVVHSQLGRAFDEAGQLDEATAHYREALGIKPDFGEVHAALGVALAKQGKFDDAFVHFQNALKSDPDDPAVHQYLANVYLARGDPGRAMQHLRYALHFQPDLVGAIVSMGMALAQQGRLDQAIDHFRKALQLAPDLGQAHLWLGMALQSQGKLEEGRQHLQTAQRLGFRPPR
jgi:Tfp pilus assembly protein PilF